MPVHPPGPDARGGTRGEEKGRAPAWPRAAARELFTACYDLLGPIATRRVHQIIARYSPELAVRAAFHNTELVVSDSGGALPGVPSGEPKRAR